MKEKKKDMLLQQYINEIMKAEEKNKLMKYFLEMHKREIEKRIEKLRIRRELNNEPTYYYFFQQYMNEKIKCNENW